MGRARSFLRSRERFMTSAAPATPSSPSSRRRWLPMHRSRWRFNWRILRLVRSSKNWARRRPLPTRSSRWSGETTMDEPSFAPIFDLEAAVAWRERLRGEGKRVVFTNGVFDIVHAGHVEYLAWARRP